MGGQMFVNNLGGVKFSTARKVCMCVAAAALTVMVAAVGLARSSDGSPKPAAPADEGKVLGMAFDGHQVSNLDNSIKFYEVLDFHVTSKTDWKVDKVANELGGTKGAQSRTAVVTTQSSVSDKPFNLILREYKGIDRKDWSTLTSADLGAGHMDLTVMDDCNPVMDKLKAIGLLKVPQMNLPGGGAAATGPRRFVFVQDPDGWFIELFAKMKPAPGAPPEGPKVSNSTATQQNIERLGSQAGFNHIGLNIIDPTKALAFYQGVLGGDYPALPDPPPAGSAPRMTMLNGWYPQAGTTGNVRLELLGSPQNRDKPAPDQKFADIGTNYVGFQVADLGAVYARVKAAGAITVSDGGIVKVPDGRAVIVKDPDVGGFVELWEAKK
jgi:catechol 2,3-dioxygenase-like lactoylglutathione lyase family enzyme